MKPLVFELVKGQRQEFNFLGWKDDGLAFYATNVEGRPAMIVPVIAWTVDEGNGEPYRFPRIDPLEIAPLECRYDIAWSQHHREVLRRWRETKMAEVDALTVEGLSGADHVRIMLDEMQGRKGPDGGIEGVRRREKDEIETHYKKLVNTPLLELFHPFLGAGLLDPFFQGRWADEMGEDFREMSRAANLVLSWCHAEEVYPDYDQLEFALQNVKYVMRGQDASEYPLIDAQVRTPTDQEASAYALLQQFARAPAGQPLESGVARIAQEREKLEAFGNQLGNQMKALAETIAPLNKLYSDVELAEIRKLAAGKAVPGLLTDFVMGQFMGSNPPRLPTKGDVFNNCGPETSIGKKLEQAGYGISKQRFSDHLTVIRRLLEEKGFLARRTPGKSRKRESHFHPDERLEDFNQPTPAESAADRDEGQQVAGLDTEEEEDKEQSGDSSERPDAD